jgi:hypothetical protein
MTALPRGIGGLLPRGNGDDENGDDENDDDDEEEEDDEDDGDALPSSSSTMPSSTSTSIAGRFLPFLLPKKERRDACCFGMDGYFMVLL